MKIGEVAGRAGVTVDTVRFYERVGVLPEPPRTESGYRDYEPGVVERIRLTRELQTIGFTLTDAVGALAAHDAGGAKGESRRRRLDAGLARGDRQLPVPVAQQTQADLHAEPRARALEREAPHGGAVRQLELGVRVEPRPA